MALKRTIEESYGYVRVRGELGKVSYHGNGHVYFDLKDDRACIAGVIWRSTAQRIKLRLEAGLEVLITGRVTTYPGRSQYQIVVETLEPAGLGALMALLGTAQAAPGRRRIVRRGAQAALAVSARRDRRHHLAERRGDPRHLASARRPLSAPRFGVAGQGAGRWLGRRSRRRDRRLQRAAGATHFRFAAAARSHHRGARRRLAGRFMVVQRRDRGARRGGKLDSADFGGRPRDRRDADRFRRRPAGADADRGRRNGGAGARRADCSISIRWRAGPSPLGGAIRTPGRANCVRPRARCRPPTKCWRCRGSGSIRPRRDCAADCAPMPKFIMWSIRGSARG